MSSWGISASSKDRRPHSHNIRSILTCGLAASSLSHNHHSRMLAHCRRDGAGEPNHGQSESLLDERRGAGLDKRNAQSIFTLARLGNTVVIDGRSHLVGIITGTVVIDGRSHLVGIGCHYWS
jgi:hypothetical protein